VRKALERLAGTRQVAAREALAHLLALRLALAGQPAHEVLHVRERGAVFLLELERQPVVQHRLGQALALLVVDGALLVVADELFELLLHLRHAALGGLVLEFVVVDRTPDRERGERLALAVAALAQLERGGAGEERRSEQRGGETDHAERPVRLGSGSSGTSTA
jgi:hypothetical protein